MPGEAATKANRAFAVGDAHQEWDVVEVHTEPLLALKVRFADGTQGRVRFEPSLLTGVFASLKDPVMFSRVHIDHGASTWPGDVDFGPMPCMTLSR